MTFPADPYLSGVRDGFEALGFNPAPGRIGAVQSLILDVEKARAKLASAAELLTSIKEAGGIWEGTAAQQFVRRSDALAKLVPEAEESFEKAKLALQNWERELSELQRKARLYEDEATTARSRLEQAEANPALVPVYAPFRTEAERSRDEREFEAAKAELENAREQMDTILDKAKRLREQHEALSKEVARALSEAAENAPDEPDMLDRIVDGVKNLVNELRDFAKEVGAWVSANAERIAAVGDVIATASGLLGLAGAAITLVNPFVGGALAAGSASLSVLSLGLHTAAELGGADVPGRTFLQDGLGSFGLGAVVRSGVDVVDAVLKSRAIDASSNAGLVDSTAGLLGSPEVLENFWPKNRRQLLETFVPGGAGFLWVGVENAWQAA